MAPGRPPKRTKIDPSRSQEASFSLLNFDLVFGSILAPFCLPKCLPFGTLFALKIDQKIDPKSDCSKGRSKIAPRAPKTPPRRPPDPPGCPQDPPRPSQNAPQEPPGPLLDRPGSRKLRNRQQKKTKKKSTVSIYASHSPWSFAMVKSHSQRSNPRGWRRWSREALFNPPPPAQRVGIRQKLA